MLNICARIEQVTDEGSPQIVRREYLHPGLIGAPAQNVQNSLIRHGTQVWGAPFVNGAEQRPGFHPADAEPRLERVSGPVSGIRDAVSTPLSAPNGHCARLGVVVGNNQRCRFAPPQPAAI